MALPETSWVTLGELQFSTSLGGERVYNDNGNARLHLLKEGPWQMSLEGPLPAFPLPSLPSLSWGPSLLRKLPKSFPPFQIKSIPTLVPVHLPASLPSTPILSLFWSSSPPRPSPSSFTWTIPAYPPVTATGRHRPSGSPITTTNHHVSSSCLPPGTAYTCPCHVCVGGGSQDVSRYCPLGFLRPGTMPIHPSILNSQGSPGY